jgi:hypothetical protein
MRDKGMGHYIMFYSDDAEPRNSHGISAQSTAEKRLFRYAVARFACYPIVLWDTGIDIRETRSESWVRWFVDWFQANDPWTHPASSRGPHAGYPIPGTALYYSDGIRDIPNHSSFVSQWKSSNKPIACTDRWRENYSSPFNGGRDKVRRAVWEMGLVGGTGVYVSGNDNGGYLSSSYASDFQAAPDCGHAARFIREQALDFGRLYPHDELINSGTVILSADPGREYVGYLRSGGSCNLDLSAIPGSATLKYYNPRTGALSPGTTIPPSASTSIPAASFSGDAVIWITANGTTGMGMNREPGKFESHIEVWPNTFRTSVEIRLNSSTVPQFRSSTVNREIKIFDINGRLVSNQVNCGTVELQHCGTSYTWSASGHPAGIYTLVVNTGKLKLVKRIILER